MTSSSTTEFPCKFCDRVFSSSKAMAGHVHAHTHDAEKSAHYSAANRRRWDDPEYRKRLLKELPKAQKASMAIRQTEKFRNACSRAQFDRFSDPEEKIKMSRRMSGSGNPNWNPDRPEQSERDAFNYRVRASLKQAKHGIFSGLLDYVWSDLGYNSHQLRDHLQKQFKEEMSWENWGKVWHIDHVVPVSRWRTNAPMSEVNALLNLRPLLVIENLSKGGRLDEEWRDE